MNSSRITHLTLQKQRGAAFIVMLVILIMGITAYLVSSLSNIALQSSRDETSTKALAQAKEALIGYAVTYGDTHTSQASGYLPCPDQGQNVIYDGEANSSCGAKNVSSIGKLPWKTLGLSPVKDGSGECLWYIVSGTYKNSPSTDLMNWDNNGVFQIMSSDGASFLAGSTAESQAVGVIIAPGTPLNLQNHSPITNTPSCGGNYTASNYLDNDTLHSINNATVSSSANAVTKFISGVVKDASGNIIVNDRVIFITRNDVFSAIKKRSDYPAFVSTLLTTSTACLAASLPAPVSMTFNSASPFTTETSGGTVIGALTTGRVPQACLTSPLDNWQDNLLYAKCTFGTSCLSINSSICRGVVIFSGEKNASQSRISNTQKNDWNNYIEGAVNTAFIAGTTTFTGASTYSAASPPTDVLACIP